MWENVFRRSWENNMLTVKRTVCTLTEIWLFGFEYIRETTGKLQNDIKHKKTHPQHNGPITCSHLIREVTLQVLETEV